MIDMFDIPTDPLYQLADELQIPVWERRYFVRAITEFLYDHGVYHTRDFWSKETEPVLVEFTDKPDLSRKGFGPNGVCIDEMCYSRDEWIELIT